MGLVRSTPCRPPLINLGSPGTSSPSTHAAAFSLDLACLSINTRSPFSFAHSLFVLFSVSASIPWPFSFSSSLYWCSSFFHYFLGESRTKTKKDPRPNDDVLTWDPSASPYSVFPVPFTDRSPWIPEPQPLSLDTKDKRRAAHKAGCLAAHRQNPPSGTCLKPASSRPSLKSQTASVQHNKPGPSEPPPTRTSTPRAQRIMSSALEAKIVVLGSQGVGKTSLVMRYCKGAFTPSQITSTVGASFMTKRVVDSDTDTVVRLQIWDTGMPCPSLSPPLPSPPTTSPALYSPDQENIGLTIHARRLSQPAKNASAPSPASTTAAPMPASCATPSPTRSPSPTWAPG